MARAGRYSEPFPCPSSGENSRYSGGFRRVAQALVDVARAERDTGVSEGRWYSAYEPLLKRFDREERYPALRGILAEGAFDEADDDSDPDNTVEFGLKHVLDGVEAFVLARSNQPESR
jgi:hypothetical protein